MRKVVQILSAIVVSLGLLSSVASAANCDGFIIINGGSGNTTEISCNDVTDITVTCENGIYVGNVSYQDGESGSAESSSGTATSGSVTNSNETQTELGTECTSENPAPAPTPQPAPPAPTVAPAPSVVPTTAKVATLPNTATNDTVSIIATSLLVAASFVVISRLGLAAYRRIGK